MKYRVTVKPENGEPISKLLFESQEEAEGHINMLRQNSDDIFGRTKADLLIVVLEAFALDDWREVTRESLLR